MQLHANWSLTLPGLLLSNPHIAALVNRDIMEKETGVQNRFHLPFPGREKKTVFIFNF